MKKFKSKNKTLLILCITFIVVFFILLVISIVSLTSFTDEKSKKMLSLDFSNVVMQAENLYNYNSQGVDSSINVIENNMKNGTISDSELLGCIQRSFQYFRLKNNNVVIDIECYYDGKLYSAVNSESIVSCEYPNRFTEGKGTGELTETNVYEVNNKKVFSYYKYDSSLDVTVAIVIDCEALALFDKSFSVEDIFITLLKSNGEIVASTRFALVGQNVHLMQSSNWKSLSDWVLTDLISNPNTIRQKSITDYSFGYYLEDADRIIFVMYHEPKSFSNYGYIILTISAFALLICGSGLSATIIRSSNKNRELHEKLLVSEIEKVEHEQFVENLCEVIEYRSQESGTHVKRLKNYSDVLANKLMELYPEYNLTKDQCDLIASASSLHDIGKIAVNDQILNKPGRLTDEERLEMQLHTNKGAEMIENMFRKKDLYYKLAYNIALYHHERYDGRGYPHKLQGEEIPIEAQIISVIDCFDALVNDRCYKKAVSTEVAYQMILNGECGNFNPKVIEAFIKAKESIIEVYDQFNELK